MLLTQQNTSLACHVRFNCLYPTQNYLRPWCGFSLYPVKDSTARTGPTQCSICPALQVHRSIPLPVTPSAEAAMVRAVPAPSSAPASSSSTGPKQLVFTDQVGATGTQVQAWSLSGYAAFAFCFLSPEHAVQQAGCSEQHSTASAPKCRGHAGALP
jgi:hypothetical protein